MEHYRQAKYIWEAALGELELQVTRASYTTWLKDTVGLSLDQDELLVGTPSTFAAEMLEQRMYSLIEVAVQKVAKAYVQVVFKVTSSGGAISLADDLKPSGDMKDRIHPSFPVGQGRPGNDYNLNHKYTFNNFVVGSSNELAHASALAVCDKPGMLYNPLFIYSGVGMGKTHLIQAIGHQAQLNSFSFMYATTEQFTNDYITAIRGGGAEAFRNRYRGVDLLLLDDIQFIIGKEQTQEGFFHTFNSLYMDNKQIVVTSDRPAEELTRLTNRIRSRLQGGLAVDISAPSLETRMAILQSKAEGMQVKVTPEATEFLAQRFTESVRALEGALNRAVAYSQLTQSPLNLEAVNLALADQLIQKAIPYSNDAILSAVAQHFQIPLQEITGSRRDRKTTTARQIAMYLLQEDGRKTPSEIGSLFGGKHRTTVTHACSILRELLAKNAPIVADVASIRNMFLG